ncbi:MAG: hypothetical protein MHM6MM_001367 [Cercozoa sp. M6MM]
MYTLVSAMASSWCEKRQVNVLVLGLDAAGKTTLLERCKQRQKKQVETEAMRLRLQTLPPTIGLNVARVTWKNKVNLTLWDVGGQSAIRRIWDKYFDDVHAVIFVVDASDSERFGEARTELHRIASHEKLAQAPILVLANKSDSPHACSAEEVMRHLDDQLLVSEHEDAEVAARASAALLDVGVSEALDWAAFPPSTPTMPLNVAPCVHFIS